MKRKSYREPLWTRKFVLLLITAIFMYITTFMFIPTLPLFARNLGVTDPSVGGIIILVYTISCLASRAIWGDTADHWERKPVYLVGVIIMATAAPFFGLVSSLGGILIIRALQGIGFSASSTSGSAIAADLVPASRLTEGIGYYTLANTIGMALGPGLGLNMFQRGSWWLFGAGTLIGIISLVTGLSLNYERKQSSVKKSSSVSQTAPQAKANSKLDMLFEKSVMPTCLVILFTIMPYGAIMAYIASYGINQGIENIGLYFSMYALSLFVVRLGVGRLSDRYGITAIIIPGIVLMFCGLIVLGWASNLTIFLISAILFGLGFGVVFPLLQATGYVFCSPDRRGVASATLFATADLAYGLGALILGIGIKFLGYAPAFGGLAIFTVVALILYISVLYPRLKKRRNVSKQ